MSRGSGESVDGLKGQWYDQIRDQVENEKKRGATEEAVTTAQWRDASTGPCRDRKGVTLVLSLLDCVLRHVTLLLDAVVPHQ